MEQFFKIFHEDDGVFVEHSFALKDFQTDGAVVELVSAEDALHIRYKKPFNSFYVELEELNTAPLSFGISYYDKNDLAWKALGADKIIDETKGFTQSGFIHIEKPLDSNNNHLWEKNTVNAHVGYGIKLVPSDDFSEDTEIKGLHILFSNDLDLIEGRHNIVSKHLPTGFNSWVVKHQATRKDIVQEIRNQGNRKFRIKKDLEAGVEDQFRYTFSDVTEFDIHDIDQIRQAAKYKTLARIFKEELSDDPEDKWFSLGDEFNEKYREAMAVFFKNLDFDDDGKQDDGDAEQDVSIPSIRLVYS